MGNKTGWIIAGFLILAVLGIIIMIVFFPSPTPPTSVTRKRDFMDAVEVEMPVTTVIGAAPSAGGNSGDDYRAAFGVYKTNETAIKAFFEKLYDDEQVGIDLSKGRISPPPDVVSALESIGSHVRAGAGKANFEYVFTHTDKKDFDVGYFYQGTFDLGRVSDCMDVLVNYLLGKKQYAQAAQAEKDLLMMGWHMANERVRLHMTLAGLDIQVGALAGLSDVYVNWGDEHRDKIRAINEYKDAVNYTRAVTNEKLEVFQASSIEPGDIFNIIEKHKDRAFRVQGLLFLGRLRYEVAGSRGDMRYTSKLIDRYAGGKDEYEAAAAKAARAMTKEQWQNLSTRLRRMDS